MNTQTSTNEQIIAFYDKKMELNTQEKIDILFNNFKEFLKEKNKRYGDSALSPIQKKMQINKFVIV